MENEVDHGMDSLRLASIIQQAPKRTDRINPNPTCHRHCFKIAVPVGVVVGGGANYQPKRAFVLV